MDCEFAGEMCLLHIGIFTVPRQWHIAGRMAQGGRLMEHATCWKRTGEKAYHSPQADRCNGIKADKANRTPGEQDYIKNAKMQPRES